MQVRSGVMRRMEHVDVGESRGYLALCISFAHITPCCGEYAQVGNSRVCASV